MEAAASTDSTLVTPWGSSPAGVLTHVSGDWERQNGQPWSEEDSAQWLDWINRRDIDHYTKAWDGAHRRAVPFVSGCRVSWPNGMTLDCRSRGWPIIVDRRLIGMAGVTTHTQLP